MVKLDKIYTRTGDKGSTRLASGEPVPKWSLRVEAYGAVDETNSAIGIARLATAADVVLDPLLGRIQNDLFDLGGDLCTPLDPNPQYPPLRIVQAQVDRLEREIDAMNERMKPLESFILPGGSEAAAWLHLARTVARRAEREMTRAAETEWVNPIAIKYANRLSDHLFVLARYLNDQGRADILWVPGKHR